MTLRVSGQNLGTGETLRLQAVQPLSGALAKHLGGDCAGPVAAVRDGPSHRSHPAPLVGIALGASGSAHDAGAGSGRSEHRRRYDRQRPKDRAPGANGGAGVPIKVRTAVTEAPSGEPVQAGSVVIGVPSDEPVEARSGVIGAPSDEPVLARSAVGGAPADQAAEGATTAPSLWKTPGRFTGRPRARPPWSSISPVLPHAVGGRVDVVCRRGDGTFGWVDPPLGWA
jgi:hypothetical protein